MIPSCSNAKAFFSSSFTIYNPQTFIMGLRDPTHRRRQDHLFRSRALPPFYGYRSDDPDSDDSPSNTEDKAPRGKGILAALPDLGLSDLPSPVPQVVSILGGLLDPSPTQESSPPKETEAPTPTAQFISLKADEPASSTHAAPHTASAHTTQQAEPSSKPFVELHTEAASETPDVVVAAKPVSTTRAATHETATAGNSTPKPHTSATPSRFLTVTVSHTPRETQKPNTQADDSRTSAAASPMETIIGMFPTGTFLPMLTLATLNTLAATPTPVLFSPSATITSAVNSLTSTLSSSLTSTDSSSSTTSSTASATSTATADAEAGGHTLLFWVAIVLAAIAGFILILLVALLLMSKWTRRVTQKVWNDGVFGASRLSLGHHGNDGVGSAARTRTGSLHGSLVQQDLERGEAGHSYESSIIPTLPPAALHPAEMEERSSLPIRPLPLIAAEFGDRDHSPHGSYQLHDPPRSRNSDDESPFDDPPVPGSRELPPLPPPNTTTLERNPSQASQASVASSSHSSSLPAEGWAATLRHKLAERVGTHLSSSSVEDAGPPSWSRNSWDGYVTPSRATSVAGHHGEEEDGGFTRLPRNGSRILSQKRAARQGQETQQTDDDEIVDAGLLGANLRGLDRNLSRATTASAYSGTASEDERPHLEGIEETDIDLDELLRPSNINPFDDSPNVYDQSPRTTTSERLRVLRAHEARREQEKASANRFGVRSLWPSGSADIRGPLSERRASTSGLASEVGAEAELPAPRPFLKRKGSTHDGGYVSDE